MRVSLKSPEGQVLVPEGQVSEFEDSESDDHGSNPYLTPYRKRIQSLSSSGSLDTFRQQESRRMKVYRMSMSDEKRLEYNRRSAERMRVYRQKKSEMNSIGKKNMTKAEKEEAKKRQESRRQRWREEKRLQRVKKKTQLQDNSQLEENEFDNDSDSPVPSCSTSRSVIRATKSRVKKTLPRDANLWCAVLGEILSEASPAKKAKLHETGLISTPNTGKHRKVCEEVVKSMTKEDELLKAKRSKDALAKRSLIKHFLSGAYIFY